MEAIRPVMLGSTILVTAVGTSAWEATRQGFARLFGRGKDDAVTVRRLDATRAQIAAAAPADVEHVRAELASQWALRLTDLLEDDPGAEAELGTLVDEVRAQLPREAATAVGSSIAAGRDVNIRADSGGIAAGIIQGNVAPPDPTTQGPATG